VSNPIGYIFWLLEENIPQYEQHSAVAVGFHLFNFNSLCLLIAKEYFT
jgi:hypothetical protein